VHDSDHLFGRPWTTRCIVAKLIEIDIADIELVVGDDGELGLDGGVVEGHPDQEAVASHSVEQEPLKTVQNRPQPGEFDATGLGRYDVFDR